MKTHLEQAELRAQLGCMSSVADVVGALRRYRRACKQLLELRHLDGELDAVAVNAFIYELDAIEELEEEEKENV